MHNLLQAPERGEFTVFGNDYDTPDGTCLRDYIHVDEVCEGIKLAIEEPAEEIEQLAVRDGSLKWLNYLNKSTM